MTAPPQRQIRAAYTEGTVTVYQAYPPEIGGPAVRDVTPLAHEVHRLVRSGDRAGAAALLPAEAPYPRPAESTARELRLC